MTTDNKLKAVAENIEFANDNSNGDEHTAGEVLLVSGQGVRRIPVPSNNPNDPLNFSRWQKLGVTITCCWFCKSQSWI